MQVDRVQRSGSAARAGGDTGGCCGLDVGGCENDRGIRGKQSTQWVPYARKAVPEPWPQPLLHSQLPTNQHMFSSRQYQRGYPPVEGAAIAARVGRSPRCTGANWKLLLGAETTVVVVACGQTECRGTGRNSGTLKVVVRHGA